MRDPPEAADVFREGEPRVLSEYENRLSREQRQILCAVIRCRTALLVGHVQYRGRLLSQFANLPFNTLLGSQD